MTHRPGLFWVLALAGFVCWVGVVGCLLAVLRSLLDEWRVAWRRRGRKP